MQVIKRPEKLAGDKVLIQPVMGHVLKYLDKTEDYKPYGVVLLNPTSPLRRTEDIDQALKKLACADLDCVFTAYGCRMCLWKIDEKNLLAASYDFIRKKRRQDMPQEYAENGAIYAFTYDYFMRTNRFLGGKMRWSLMPRAVSIDINNELDFVIAEFLMKYMKEHPEIQD